MCSKIPCKLLPLKYVGVAYANFLTSWRKASYLRTNVWQLMTICMLLAAAACSSWVYSIITNFSTRLVYGLRARDHVTDATIELHWLPMRASINFKLCLLVHRALKSERPITQLRCRAATVCHHMWPQDTQICGQPITTPCSSHERHRRFSDHQQHPSFQEKKTQDFSLSQILWHYSAQGFSGLVSCCCKPSLSFTFTVIRSTQKKRRTWVRPTVQGWCLWLVDGRIESDDRYGSVFIQPSPEWRLWLPAQSGEISHNAMVTCEIQLFHNYFRSSLRLVNIFQHVQCRWNNFEIISAAKITLFQFQTWLHVK